MADEFDPLKQETKKYVEATNVYDEVRRSTTDPGDLLRSEYEIISKPVNRMAYVNSPELKIAPDAYEKLNHASNASKAPVQSMNPFDEDVRRSTSSSSIKAKPLQETMKSEESQQQSNIPWQHDTNYQEEYETDQPSSAYDYDDYQDETLFKKKGFSVTMNRLVHRFPVLSLFYNPAAGAAVLEAAQAVRRGEPYFNDEEQETENGASSLSADGKPMPHELVGDALALHERYSNKSRTQIIRLPANASTQPLGVCIHRKSYTLYVCDVGRSVVDIFNMYGKLLHTIDDQTMKKFQPTGIAIAEDGTIVVASHFQHRLHMYSPDDRKTNEYEQESACAKTNYNFVQYILGSFGNDILQFEKPAGIAIDHTDGYLYVCDRGNFRIQVIRPEGVCERVIELLSYDPNECQLAPLQIAHQVNLEQIVCIVGNGDAICFFSKYANGPTYVEPVYISDNNGLGIEGASGITIDAEDQIYISDTNHHRVVVCSPDGYYMTHFGTEGNGPGELMRPCGIDMTSDGTIVVADGGNKRLQLFGSVRERLINEDG